MTNNIKAFLEADARRTQGWTGGEWSRGEDFTVQPHIALGQTDEVVDFIAAASRIAPEIRVLIEENERLKSQLPESMQECTIIFKECPKGHGDLTAKNWVQHECQRCKYQAMQEAFEQVCGFVESAQLYTVPDPSKPVPPHIANDLVMLEGILAKALTTINGLLGDK